MRDELVAGRVRLAFESAYLPEVQAKKLRAIAVGSQTRLRALPDVPTASEAGLPGYESSVWLGVFAPKGTPADVVARLSALIVKVLTEPQVQADLQARGYVVHAQTGETLRLFLESAQRPPRIAPPARSSPSFAPQEAHAVLR